MTQENQILGWVLLAVLFIVITGAIFYLIYRFRNPRAKKAQGRSNNAGKAVGLARRFARANDFKLIAPATLARKGMTAQLDAIVVGYFGVLGVKALGYSGAVYGSAEDDTWVQVAEDGQRNSFKNPITEAAGDVRVIRDALFSTKQKMVPVEVVCVFTEPSADIAVPRRTGHYTLKTFKELLGKEKYREDKGIDLDLVEKALQDSVVE